jgi:hypothetical protein
MGESKLEESPILKDILSQEVRAKRKSTEKGCVLCEMEGNRRMCEIDAFAPLFQPPIFDIGLR